MAGKDNSIDSMNRTKRTDKNHAKIFILHLYTEYAKFTTLYVCNKVQIINPDPHDMITCPLMSW